MYILILDNCMLSYNQVDPFLSISDDYRVYAKIHVDVREYGTAADNQLACSMLSELQNKIRECQSIIRDALVHNLANVTEVLHYMRGYFVHNPPLSHFLVFSCFLSWMQMNWLCYCQRNSSLMKSLCSVHSQCLIRIK